MWLKYSISISIFMYYLQTYDRSPVIFSHFSFTMLLTRDILFFFQGRNDRIKALGSSWPFCVLIVTRFLPVLAQDSGTEWMTSFASRHYLRWKRSALRAHLPCPGNSLLAINAPIVCLHAQLPEPHLPEPAQLPKLTSLGSIKRGENQGELS